MNKVLNTAVLGRVVFGSWGRQEVIYQVQNCHFVAQSVARQSFPVHTFVRSPVLVVVFAFL